jgi:DNA-binding PadR family transcriptional regulator
MSRFTRAPLGDVEQRVLLAIHRLGADASGVPIVNELRRQTRRPVLLPSVYLALRRLEDKGLIRSRLGDPEARRGGRARRFFSLEAAGRAALREAKQAALALWRGVSLDESK